LPIKSFYWSKQEDAKRLWQEFKEIGKREGKPISQLFREFVEQYVQLHEPGNPQQRLDTIVRLGKKYVSPKLCGFKNCMRDAVAVGTYKSQVYPLCENHLRLVSDALEWKIKKLD
jgi:hypothetical protein